MLASKDLIRQSVVAVIVAKIEALTVVEILHFEQQTQPAGARAHGLQLQWSVAAGEHAARD
jgi:hypothetical protein